MREKAKYQDDNIFASVSKKALENKHPTKPQGWKSEEVYNRNLSIYNRFIYPSLKTFNIKRNRAISNSWNTRNDYTKLSKENQKSIKYYF